MKLENSTLRKSRKIEKLVNRNKLLLNHEIFQVMVMTKKKQMHDTEKKNTIRSSLRRKLGVHQLYSGFLGPKNSAHHRKKN